MICKCNYFILQSSFCVSFFMKILNLLAIWHQIQRAGFLFFGNPALVIMDDVYLIIQANGLTADSQSERSRRRW